MVVCHWKAHKYKSKTKFETGCKRLTMKDPPDTCPFCGLKVEAEKWPSDLDEEV